MKGFAGKILHVNLTNHQTTIEEPDEAFYRLYPGGSLMGLYYLWRNTPPGIDAFDPRNTLTFALSAATGLPISGQSRCSATCKSPTTQGVADSQAGGFWPAELKFAGFDAVVVQGASPTPVYLWINNGQAELRDAAHLWGHFTHDVDEIIKAEHGDDKIEIAQIGPAGEKLSMFAAVMNMSNRAWGRTGIGAVMGSKRLKAIAVRGAQQPTTANKKVVVALSRQGPKRMPERTDVASLGRYGTADVVMGQQGSGGLPTHNWDSGAMDIAAAEAISGERLYLELLRGAAEGAQDKLGRDTCYACIVRCKRVIEAEYRDKALLPEYGGMEYETISTFGSYCGISDLRAIGYASQLCNMYGVDSISCGATLAWAMECYEQGVLTLEDTDGIPLNYGNAEAMIAMLEKTLRREGLGDVLAEGSARAAKRLGKGQEFVLTVKGQEIPAHMPHVKRSLGLIYAVNPFGADHQSSEHDPMYHPKLYEGKPEAPGYKRYLAQIGLNTPTAPKAMNPEKIEFALKTQYNYSATDVLDYCQFVFGPSWQLYGPQDMADLLAAATGWDVTVDEIQTIGRRRLNLMRAYNAREGLTRDHDTLPNKLFTRPLSGGRSDGIVLDPAELDWAITHYFELAGWDVETGTPRRATLEEVGLGWVAEELSSGVQTG